MVSIEITHSELKALVFVFEQADFKCFNKEFKAVMAISKEIYIKLYKKEIDKRGKTEKFKLNFKYYEAYALERFLRGAELFLSYYQYESNVCLKVANELDKKI
ncbi:hypothetical protein [Apibacter mensalis]|nr:hypothetical protein [Apibacter mensalis]